MTGKLSMFPRRRSAKLTSHTIKQILTPDANVLLLQDDDDGEMSVLKVGLSEADTISEMAIHHAMQACFSNTVIACQPIYYQIAGEREPHVGMSFSYHEPADLLSFLGKHDDAALSHDFYHELFSIIAKAIAFFHRAGLLVLDIKPENIIVAGWKTGPASFMSKHKVDGAEKLAEIPEDGIVMYMVYSDNPHHIPLLRLQGLTHYAHDPGDGPVVFAIDAMRSQQTLELPDNWKPLPAPEAAVYIADLATVRAAAHDIARECNGSSLAHPSYSWTRMYSAPDETGKTEEASYATDVYKLGLIFSKLLVDPHGIRGLLPQECAHEVLRGPPRAGFDDLVQLTADCLEGRLLDAMAVHHALAGVREFIQLPIQARALSLLSRHLLTFGCGELQAEVRSILRYISANEGGIEAVDQCIAVLAEDAADGDDLPQAWHRLLEWELERLGDKLTDAQRNVFRQTAGALVTHDRMVRFLQWASEFQDLHDLHESPNRFLNAIFDAPRMLLSHPLSAAILFDSFPPWRLLAETASTMIQDLRRNWHEPITCHHGTLWPLVVLNVIRGNAEEAQRWYALCQPTLEKEGLRAFMDAFEAWSVVQGPKQVSISSADAMEAVINTEALAEWMANPGPLLPSSRLSALGRLVREAAQAQRPASSISFLLIEDYRLGSGLFSSYIQHNFEVVRELVRALPSAGAYEEDYPLDAAWFYEAAMLPVLARQVEG
jgi:serine/threonine protein kinase